MMLSIAATKFISMWTMISLRYLHRQSLFLAVSSPPIKRDCLHVHVVLFFKSSFAILAVIEFIVMTSAERSTFVVGAFAGHPIILATMSWIAWRAAAAGNCAWFRLEPVFVITIAIRADATPF